MQSGQSGRPSGDGFFRLDGEQACHLPAKVAAQTWACRWGPALFDVGREQRDAVGVLVIAERDATGKKVMRGPIWEGLQWTCGGGRRPSEARR